MNIVRIEYYIIWNELTGIAFNYIDETKKHVEWGKTEPKENLVYKPKYIFWH